MNQTRDFLKNGAILAPMAGVTDLPFRLLCREKGSICSVTEMISARGILATPHGLESFQKQFESLFHEGPVGVQIFGHDPGQMAAAASMIEEQYGFAFIDINMGCPAKKIVSNGDGAALLRNVPLAASIVSAVRRAVSFPVTVKFRLGWDKDSIIADRLARVLEENGADAICLHGRTREQQYSGMADWNAIRRIHKCVNIPMIGNGDISSADEAVSKLHMGYCDGVMVGRAAMGNPWIFSQIRDKLAGRKVKSPDTPERCEMMMRHAYMLSAWKGEALAMTEMRKHAAWYTRGIPGASRIRIRLMRVTTLDEMKDILKQEFYFEK